MHEVSVSCSIQGHMFNNPPPQVEKNIIDDLGEEKKHPRFNDIPMALERLSPPLTLPSEVTLPPAATIRFSSGLSSGL